MIVELAHFCLILSVGLSFLQTVRGRFMPDPQGILLLSRCSFFLVLVAFLGLGYAFLTFDTSVQYVFENSSRSLPWYYRFSAIWAAHEGSMLLWLLILGLWQRIVHRVGMESIEFKAAVISVMGSVSGCIGSYIIFVSNPFIRMKMIALKGMGLNALLQHPGLAIHPPILYLGYVGMTVPFSALIGQLYCKVQLFDWQALRRLLLLAWFFLSIGIVLGSWWAYHVLGWGGWWFWDPVENISLLPWLLAGMMIHLAIIPNKNKIVLEWWNLSAILLMTLVLLGVFLVRSGVLVSVHAFANDPSRGLALLLLLVIQLSASIVFYWLKSHHQNSDKHDLKEPVSWMLWIPVAVYAFTLIFVFMGTLYPLIVQSFGLGQLSVGAPYYNQLVVPAVLVALLGLSFVFNNAMNYSTVVKLLMAIILSRAFMILFDYPLQTTTYGWLTLSVFAALNQPFSPKRASFWGHVGFYLLVASIAINSGYRESKNVIMSEGEIEKLGDYTFELKKIESIKKHNGAIKRLNILVDHKGDTRSVFPAMRWFNDRKMLLPKSGISRYYTEDVMISLGKESSNGWRVRLLRQPMIQWIWIAGLVIAGSGLIGFFQNKRRSR